MLTNKQKQALHRAARMMGPDFTEEARRLVQRNVGAFHSAADKIASRGGFIAVMAWYETELAKADRVLSATPTYWRDQLRDLDPAAPMRHRLRKVAAELGWSDEFLDNFIASNHMSRGAAPNVAEASTYWLWRAIQALQAMQRRLAEDHAAEAAGDKPF